MYVDPNMVAKGTELRTRKVLRLLKLREPTSGEMEKIERPLWLIERNKMGDTIMTAILAFLMVTDQEVPEAKILMEAITVSFYIDNPSWTKENLFSIQNPTDLMAQAKEDLVELMPSYFPNRKLPTLLERLNQAAGIS